MNRIRYFFSFQQKANNKRHLQPMRLQCPTGKLLWRCKYTWLFGETKAFLTKKVNGGVFLTNLGAPMRKTPYRSSQPGYRHSFPGYHHSFPGYRRF